MSKVNAMQAIREARYAARASVTAPAVPTRSARIADSPIADRGGVDAGEGEAVKGAFVADPSESSPAASDEAICGHRSMNNRICKRPAGHSEKNHRYH